MLPCQPQVFANEYYDINSVRNVNSFKRKLYKANGVEAKANSIKPLPLLDDFQRQSLALPLNKKLSSHCVIKQS